MYISMYIFIYSPHYDQQKITTISLHMRFGLPGSLRTCFEPKENTPDAATLTLQAFS